jgi:hypothetical protein
VEVSKAALQNLDILAIRNGAGIDFAGVNTASNRGIWRLEMRLTAWISAAAVG